jgi:hypothetical protein
LKESGGFLSKLWRSRPVNPADFHAPSAGRVVQAPGGFAAFVPAPLGRKPNALKLLDELFVNPYITAARAVRVLGVSGPTARHAIALLQAEGVLGEMTGRSWGRIYLARPILQAIEARA